MPTDATPSTDAASPAFTTRIAITTDAPTPSAVLRLLYDVLYRDFDVDPAADWRTDERGTALATALAETGELLGTARLMPVEADAARCQLRQLAVAPSARGAGVGSALVAALEARAAEKGATEVWLHARECAYAFYERLGYRYVSEVFVSSLTGIPHRTMVKPLG